MYSDKQHYIICKVKELAIELGRNPMKHELQNLLPRVNVNIDLLFGPSWDSVLAAAGLLNKEFKTTYELKPPKILVLDIECKPIKAWVWGLFDQNIGIDMIIEDWSLMSWSAKWLGESEVFYQDVSNQNDKKNDKQIVHGIWNLLNDCNVVLTQNGKKFDIPKLNGKFEEYGFGPPRPFRHIDTITIAKKLGLTSKKLAFMTEKFNRNYKKLSHEKFPGFSLWEACLNGNMEAWEEMKKYNIHDVLATEELYLDHLRKWDNTINHAVYTGNKGVCINCGSNDLDDIGPTFTKTAVNNTYKCKICGSISQGKENLILKEARKNLLK